MRRTANWTVLCLAVCLWVDPSLATARDAVGYRTGPSSAAPTEIARGFLRDWQAARGVGAADLARWRQLSRHVGRRSGITHLVLRQTIDGIDVWNGDVTLAIAPDGRLLSLRPRFVGPAIRRARARAVRIGAAEALRTAAADSGIDAAGPITESPVRSGPARATRLHAPALSAEEIEARLVYVEQPGGLRLAWSFDLPRPDGRHWWVFNVDAATGDVLTRLDRVRHAQYRVYALPLESPDDGPRTLEVDPADPNASPFGWHDGDGLAGPDFDDSQGNNVFAAENASPGPISLVVGGPTLDFDFPLDPNAPPTTYPDASVTNLFYWNNVLHDLHFHYGFDEASGNFQLIHYGSDPNGIAGDDPTALAQDYNSVNNASMATPADGSRPIMRMHLWSVPVLDVSAPASLRGRKEAADAVFGPALTVAGVSAEIAEADPVDACSALTNPGQVVGRIALIERGSCDFINKVDRAETAGALGAIVVNNVEGPPIPMGAANPNNPKVAIPSLMVRRDAGLEIRSELASGPVTAKLQQSERDSDLDNGVIIHEFGHGVSTRLTGGAANANCLLAGQGDGMGEGWSDFWALAITADPNDTAAEPRSIGSYLVGEPGIRNFPYSTDPAVNPQTFGDVPTTNAPHGVGEIWALALWETYWLLVDALGFDPDLYEGTGGNNVMLQLVSDGLKLQPCDPDFVEARDAILAADLMTHAGAYTCRIWRGFAKRGIGHDAVAAPLAEGFALPPSCPLCGDADLNGLVETADEARIRSELALPGTLTPSELADCAARAFSGACDIVEVALLRRGLAGVAPGLGGSCAAFP